MIRQETCLLQELQSIFCDFSLHLLQIIESYSKTWQNKLIATYELPLIEHVSIIPINDADFLILGENPALLILYDLKNICIVKKFRFTQSFANMLLLDTDTLLLIGSDSPVFFSLSNWQPFTPLHSELDNSVTELRALDDVAVDGFFLAHGDKSDATLYQWTRPSFTSSLLNSYGECKKIKSFMGFAIGIYEGICYTATDFALFKNNVPVLAWDASHAENMFMNSTYIVGLRYQKDDDYVFRVDIKTLTMCEIYMGSDYQLHLVCFPIMEQLILIICFEEKKASWIWDSNHKTKSPLVLTDTISCVTCRKSRLLVTANQKLMLFE